jgi:hypothetical protein
MAIILPSGFNITNIDPIDSRFTVATQAARLGFSAANVYEGLVVFQRDTNELYVLTNTGSYNSVTGWELVGTPTGSFATTGSNRFNGNQTITGSIIFNSGSQITSTYYGNNYPGYIDIVAGAPDGFVELLSYNQSSSVNVDDYSVYITTHSGSLFNLWEFKNSGRLVASIAGGIEAPSFTGSLFGTSSWSQNGKNEASRQALPNSDPSHHHA